MPPSSNTVAPAWTNAAVAASLLAVDPQCGAAIHSLPGPVRDRWLELLRELLPVATPIRRIPLGISDARLLGGLDLPATLRAGRPIADRGVLAEADGGIVVLAMAERIQATTAARLTGILDTGIVLLERDGLTLSTPLTIGVVALDESMTDDEQPPPPLLDRLAFHLEFDGLRNNDATDTFHDAAEVAAGRIRLPGVRVSDATLRALCETAAALGIDSIRAPLLAMRVARAAAALNGRDEVAEDDATLAARLVLAPRATRLPPSEQPPEQEEPPPPEPPENPDENPGDDESKQPPPAEDKPLEDLVLEAAQAAIPAGLLARLAMGNERSRPKSGGRAGAMKQSQLRGRPAGVRRGEPRQGARLNVVETLRAAAPWQRLRGRDVNALRPGGVTAGRIEVRLEDFHVTRYRQRSETTTIFVVDASGSAALHRLAEAKGAVNLLLAECYVRRDRVAVLAFRGHGADLLLPPTRSLVRAQRSLAALPGGGGTPLAAGVDAATALAVAVKRRGGTPTVVFLTDGRANIARDGGPGRTRAHEDAVAAARLLRAHQIRAILIDTSPHAHHLASDLATEMGARYLALPYADARMLSRAVIAATPPPHRNPAD